jgi:hypothetical protein
VDVVLIDSLILGIRARADGEQRLFHVMKGRQHDLQTVDRKTISRANEHILSRHRDMPLPRHHGSQPLTLVPASRVGGDGESDGGGGGGGGQLQSPEPELDRDEVWALRNPTLHSPTRGGSGRTQDSGTTGAQHATGVYDPSAPNPITPLGPDGQLFVDRQQAEPGERSSRWNSTSGRGSVVDVGAHDREVRRRMIHALEDAPQTLSSSRKAWEDKVFLGWIEEHYANTKRGDIEWNRLKSLWDVAVSDYHDGQHGGRGVVAGEQQDYYGHYDDGAYAIDSRGAGGRVANGRVEKDPSSRSFITSPRKEMGGSKVTVAGGQSRTGFHSKRHAREVKDRSEVSMTEKKGVAVMSTVTHTEMTSVDADHHKRSRRKHHKVAKKTLLSRVGGGFIATTMEENYGALIQVQVQIPSSKYSEEDQVFDILCDETDHVARLKELIADKSGVPATQQRLRTSKPLSDARGPPERLNWFRRHCVTKACGEMCCSLHLPSLCRCNRCCGCCDDGRRGMRYFKHDEWKLEDYEVENGDTIRVSVGSDWRQPWWLVLLTLIQLIMVYADHHSPEVCINVLDLGTEFGQCDKLLRSGEFTCEHDFCPECNLQDEGYQAHDCDLACNFCPEHTVQPCPTPPPPPPPCVNNLDYKVGAGTCDRLLAEGSFSCVTDFCTDCEGTVGQREGIGSGGHQQGECNLACNLCPEPQHSNCTIGWTDPHPLYPVEWLPHGYLAETPLEAEVLVCVLLVVLNALGFFAIVLQDRIIRPSQISGALEVHAPVAQIINGVIVVLVAICVGATAPDGVQDVWVFLYGFSAALVLLWSVRFGFPARTFYPVALIQSAMQFMVTMLFLGFDYSIGLVILSFTFYLANLVVVLFTPEWLGALCWSAQLVLLDGLFFWSALFGLEWRLGSQLILLGGAVRLGASLAWIWGLKSARGELDKIHHCVVSVIKHAAISISAAVFLGAATQPIAHHRIAISRVAITADALLSLLPFGLLTIAVLFDLSDRRLPPWLGGKAVGASSSGRSTKGWRQTLQSDYADDTVPELGDIRSPLPSGRSPLGAGGGNGAARPAAVTPRAAAEAAGRPPSVTSDLGAEALVRLPRYGKGNGKRSPSSKPGTAPHRMGLHGSHKRDSAAHTRHSSPRPAPGADQGSRDMWDTSARRARV